MSKVAVIGAGAWGTALAVHAVRQGHEVTIWALEPEVVDEIEREHRNSPYLGGVELPEALRATGDVSRALRGAEIAVLVPPSKYLRSIAEEMGSALPARCYAIVATKGIEEGSLQLMSQVLADALPELGPERLAFLSGPSFAREVAGGLPTDVTLASQEGAAARALQPLLHAPVFRVYSSADPVGVQVGGALKNVAAVASGACDGLGLGTNARAALVTRALAEITRLGVALGADPLTFLGLAGVGDLLLTCTGELSRNRALGMKLAEGVDPREYLASQRSVAEGFYTAAAAYDLAGELSVDMPIANAVYQVLHRGQPLEDAVRELISREHKDELRGIRDQRAMSTR